MRLDEYRPYPDLLFDQYQATRLIHILIETKGTGFHPHWQSTSIICRNPALVIFLVYSGHYRTLTPIVRNFSEVLLDFFFTQIDIDI